ncbi:MAG: DNA topoisomerase III, partial [Burkholderiaceae bacterium]|nr:DNA topoisomerase III [Burkholderiaceae bacterium]
EGDAKRRGRYGAKSASTAPKLGAAGTASAAPAKTSARATAKTASKTAARKTAAAKTPRAGSLMPSPQLAAIIGPGPFGRGEVMKKLWDYIKANSLQDPKDKRTIVADAKLRPLLGADSVGMFKLAGIAGRHLQG